MRTPRRERIEVVVFCMMLLAGCLGGSTSPEDPIGEGTASWHVINPFVCLGVECDEDDWNAAAFVDDKTIFLAGTDRRVSRSTDGGETWSHARLDDDGWYFTSIAFADANTGWVVGRSKRIYKTTDGGGSWTLQDSGTNSETFQSIAVLDKNRLWVGKDDGSLRHSTDGGATWTDKATGCSGFARLIEFPTASVGYVLCEKNLAKTTDGGASWRVIDGGGAPIHSASSAVTFRGMDFLDANRGWIVDENGIVYKTPDGGTTWTQHQAGEPGGFRQSIGFANANTGWMVAEAGKWWKTTDGGVTWNEQPQMTRETLRFVDFRNATTGLAVGRRNQILITRDGGTVWSHASAGQPEDLHALHFVDAMTGWVVGDNEKILKTTNGGRTWKLQFPRRTPGVGERSAFTYVRFVNKQTGWILASEGGRSFRTTDGGATWSDMGQDGDAMDFVDANRGWITGDEDEGLKTTDGGATWTTVPDLHGRFLDFVDQTTGWRIVQGDELQKTTDGGTTWTTQVPLPLVDDPRNAAYFLNASTGWFVGRSGQIRKTTDGGTSWVPQASGTTRHLASVSFADAAHGLVTGSRILLGTTNGGQDWTVLDSTWSPSSVQLLRPNLGYAISGRRIYRYSPSAP